MKQYVKYKGLNIKFCDEKLINTRNLIDICDTVVTGSKHHSFRVRFYGKKPIIAGFILTLELLFNVVVKRVLQLFGLRSKSSKLSKNQIKLARKILYYVENSLSIKNEQVYF